MPARLRRLLDALTGMLSERVLLLTLELQLAGRALGLIVLLVGAAAVAALTAWGALWLIVAAWVVEAGWGWAWAALLVATLNAAAAAAALLKARALYRLLALPATLRHLTIPSAEEDVALPAAEPSR
jgi:hypothetical protein